MFPVATGFPLIRKSTSIPGTDVIPFKVLPKTVMLPLPEDVIEVDVVAEVEDAEIVVELVVEGNVVLDTDVVLDETEVVEVDTVDIDGIVVVDVVECVDIEYDVVENETVVTDELGKTCGESRRVNKTSEDTRITIMTAPAVMLLVLFIVFIRM